MNAQANAVAQQTNSSNQFVGLLNLEAFELSQRVAKMLSSSTLVPEQYRAVTKVKAGKDNNGNWQFRDEPNPSGLSNCVIALNIANRLNADALMVMQNLYIIEGRPAWSSQFIMAAINSCGRFSSLRFELKELGEKEVEYQETQWNNGRKNIVTKKVKINDMSCFAWVEEKGSVDLDGKPVILKSSVITVEMAVKEGWYQKNGSKWQTMPEQMLRYRAASFFGRVYAPELLMGLKSEEEERDLIDVTPEPEVKNTAGQVRALKQKILASKSLDDLAKLEKEIAELSESDWDSINDIFVAQRGKFLEDAQVVDAELTESEVTTTKATTPSKTQDEQIEDYKQLVRDIENTPLNQAEQPVNRRQPKEVEKVSSLAIRKDFLVRMNKAVNLDELKAIHDEFVKNDGLTGQHLAYLKDTYTQHKEKLSPTEVQKTDTAAVDSVKSNSVKAGLERMIADAVDVISLEAEVARAIKGSESKMTLEHNQAVLVAYAQRKEILAQQDIFESTTTELNPIDATIQKIKVANSQDEINAIFADPALEALSDDDMALLNQAADMRESELQG